MAAPPNDQRLCEGGLAGPSGQQAVQGEAAHQFPYGEVDMSEIPRNLFPRILTAAEEAGRTSRAAQRRRQAAGMELSKCM